MGGLFSKCTIFLLVLLVLCLLTLGIFRSQLEPKLLNLARSESSAVSSRMINEAVSERIARGDMSYEKIICFEKDYEGKITALRTNMQQVSSLKTGILKTINAELLDQNSHEIGVSLGNLIFPELFAGRGPGIPVRILSVRRSRADFVSHFTQAGINQTLHSLTLRVEVEGTILVLGHILDFSASDSVLVAETVIVGQVPETYS